MTTHALLSVQNVWSRYKGGVKLGGVSLEVEHGKLVAILGANGAGKSTLLGVISGLFRPSEGKVLLDGVDLTGMPAYRVVRVGIAMAPQNNPVFPSMTVDENLAIGVTRAGEEIFAMFPNLRAKRSERAGRLSGGERQMLSMAQAFLTKPKVLLLDEPSSGLAPIIVHQVFAAVKQLVRTGMTVLLVEQNARAALEMADRAYVMEQGRIVLDGPAHTISENDHVRRAYLGL
jgi:branched-chain amino acid transport system ATP-binding protein